MFDWFAGGEWALFIIGASAIVIALFLAWIYVVTEHDWIGFTIIVVIGLVAGGLFIMGSGLSGNARGNSIVEAHTTVTEIYQHNPEVKRIIEADTGNWEIRYISSDDQLCYTDMLQDDRGVWHLVHTQRAEECTNINATRDNR